MFSSITRAALCAFAFLTLAACASSRNLDQSFSDLGGNAQIKGVLFSDRNHDYSDVDITLFEGRLLLTGSMRSEDGRDKLIANAWKASGVDQVIDEIFIGDKTPFLQGVADARTDQTLRAKLVAADDVVSARYKIAVSGGIIYLIGAAKDQRELDRALEIASATGKAEKVINYVTVLEATTPDGAAQN